MARVLLVEDNETNRDMLTRRLVRRGFEVSIAEDGLRGVELAAAEQPDIVLMDLSCPGSTAGRRRAGSRRIPGRARSR